MNFIPSNRPIHICVRPHDLRYGARFLLAQARNSQEKFDYDGFYVYTNARYTLIKILWLEERHICMCVRRLNKGTYRWPKAGQKDTSEWRLLKRAPDAGETSAILYTMAEECRRCKVNAETWINETLQTLASGYTGDYLALLPQKSDAEL